MEVGLIDQYTDSSAVVFAELNMTAVRVDAGS